MTVPALRPNFFLLLELHPDTPWDQEKYEKALQGKSRQWNRDSSGIAKKALAAQANRALIPEIHRIMENSVLRHQEAMQARVLLARNSTIAKEHFEKQLMLLNLKESVDAEELALFIQKYKNIVPAELIKKRITVKVRSTKSQVTDELWTLDTSMLKNITHRLEVVQKKTLYDLLELEKCSTTPEILRAAEQLYAREVQQPPTAETTAKVELAGFALSLFQTEEMRTRYDTALRQASLMQLLLDLEENLERSTVKEIHPKQVLYYLRKAYEAGWKSAEALEMLKDYGRARQWFLTIPRLMDVNEQKVRSNAKLLAENSHTNNIRVLIEQSRTYEEIENVQELQYSMFQSSIRFYWKWPQNCHGAYITYSIQTRVIQHHMSNGTTYYVSRTEYEKVGYYEISGIQNQGCSFRISSIIDRDGIQIVAQGTYLCLHHQITTINYAIQISRFLFKKRWLYVCMDAPGSLPPLILTGKLHSLPLDRTDGTYFQRIVGQTNEKGEIHVKLPHCLSVNTFGKLFLEDDRLSHQIMIHHPVHDKLRLS